MLFIAPARYFQLAGLVKSLRGKGAAVDLSHLRVALSGGAAMSADLQKTCSEVLGVAIAQAYGCTEHLLVSADTVPPTVGSVGKLGAGVRAKVRYRPPPARGTHSVCGHPTPHEFAALCRLP